MKSLNFEAFRSVLRLLPSHGSIDDSITTMAFCTKSPTNLAKPEQVYELSRVFSSVDVANFMALTGDHNPIHKDTAAAASLGFAGPILPGMLCASLFPAIIAQHFPRAVYAAQDLRFRRVALVGSRIIGKVQIQSHKANLTKFQTVCLSEDGNIIIEGTALAKLNINIPNVSS